MSNKFLKQLVTVITSLTKAKSLALRTKASALKKGAVLLSLFHNKRFLATTLSQRIHDLLPSSTRHDKGGEEEGEEGIAEKDMAMVRYARREYVKGGGLLEEYEDKYPDLRHGLFREEEDTDREFEDPGGSVVDIVKGAKEEGEEFVLEDEIDRVADLFIRRFHRQMRMQKQLSLKRVHDMLQRSL
ncbi:hypothetical protein MLD38_013572 [Melastoma candidum]|uniref:Uncharacterized protein n=1 Tax=Melastoma candidum TaxID=119954 RepID=A0ACB9RD49_9MYRT|nr:hypothetical protein MLD38_013572 [Melastoma candidum]